MAYWFSVCLSVYSSWILKQCVMENFVQKKTKKKLRIVLLKGLFFFKKMWVFFSLVLFGQKLATEVVY